MDVLKQLFQSRGWLVALWALIRACITGFFPQIPQSTLVGLDTFVAATIVVIVGADARQAVATERKLRALDASGEHVA